MKKILTCVITILCAMTIQAKDEIVITNGDFTCLKEKGKRAIVHIDWSNAEIVKFANDEKSIEEQLGSFDNFMAQQDDDALVNMVIKPRLQKKHYGRKEWMNIQIKQAQAKMKPNAEPIVLWEPSKEEIISDRMVFYQILKADNYNYDNKKAMQFLMQRDSANAIIAEGWIKEMEKMHLLYDNLETQEYDYIFTIKIDTIDLGNGGASETAAMVLGQVMKGKIGGAIIKGSLTCTDAKTHEIIATADMRRVKGFGASFDVDRIQSALITIFNDIKEEVK